MALRKVARMVGLTIVLLVARLADLLAAGLARATAGPKADCKVGVLVALSVAAKDDTKVGRKVD